MDWSKAVPETARVEKWPPAASAGYAVEDKVRLLKDIWDDGCEGHHPPGYLAMRGETLVVREIGGVNPAMTQRIYVSHEHRTDASFAVYMDEIEPV